MVFDIETNSDDPFATTTVHSLVIGNRDTGEILSYADRSGYPSIASGLDVLSAADEISGHNVLGYDIPQLKKLRGWEPRPETKVWDTLLMARLYDPDISERDFEAIQRKKGYGPTFPAKLIASHSLEAWGHRLGIRKDDFGKNADWSVWSESMQKYCEQDVRVNLRLHQFLDEQKIAPLALQIEHDFQRAIVGLEANGFGFDAEKTARLYVELSARRRELHQQLSQVFPPTEVEMKTPAYWTVPGDKHRYATKVEAEKARKGQGIKGEIERGPNKVKQIPFNPASRQQVAERLMALGWKPTKETDGGQPCVDDDVLQALPYPEAKVLAEYFLVNKRLGQLSDGTYAWMKLVRNGRIHGRIITIGAVTGRCAHKSPNLAQVPRVVIDKETKQLVHGYPWGTECRELFTATDGDVLVGADASGLELRMLGHYLAAYDGGKYAKEVVQGDIHTANQKAFGLPDGKAFRNNAKTGIYCLIYGGGPAKLGKSLFPDTTDDAKAMKIGRTAKARFVRAVPAYEKLQAAVAKRLQTRKLTCPLSRVACPYLLGIDGRALRIRSPHAALNTLLQSAGAVAVKLATNIAVRTLTERGIYFKLVAHVHDEMQIQCKPQDADLVGQTVVDAVQEAGRQLNLKVPLSGEYKIGRNWAETH